MANYRINLSPDLVNIATEGGLDTSVTNGKSLQRTANGLMTKTNSGRKIVGRLEDNSQFNDTVQKLKDFPGVIKTSGDIYIFINDDYVDYLGSGYGNEAKNLVSFMDDAGISYETFTDVSESVFASLESNAKLMIPELEHDDLLPALSTGARSAIRDFVDNGGTLIMFEPDSGDLLNVLNTIFSFSLDGNGASEPISLSMAGAVLFPNESATIPNNNGTDGLDTSTLPMGSVSIYEGNGTDETVVAMIPYGSGKIYVLGWDWFDAAPVGEQDDGWNHLLQSILES